MSSLDSPALYRLSARSALGTTAYGYEVVGRSSSTDACIRTVSWIECWCPDAAQFILLDAPAALCATNCNEVLDAICASQSASKLRLVLTGTAIARDRSLVDRIQRRDVGLLLDLTEERQLDDYGELGLLGVRLSVDSLAKIGERNCRHLVVRAHDAGMRVIATRMPPGIEPARLFAAGVDYVSMLADAIRPVDTRALFAGRALTRPR